MPTVRSLGERALIQRLARRLGTPGPRVRVGIGDDAAVLGGGVLLASDMCVEGVHFTARLAPERIGWKALAVNVSDIAAMGGTPIAAVVSLGCPPGTSVRRLERIYTGLRRCARRCNMAIVGGDTVRAPRLILDVAILGTAKRPVLRKGAKVGDALIVTGTLGGALSSGRHATFVPRVGEGRTLARRGAHAMLDLSDGLAQDLWQLARASRVTLRVDVAQVPCHGTLHQALHDGEDFELLAAIPPRRVPRRIGRTRVTRIGSVVARRPAVELQYPDGRIRPLTPSGFRHF